MSVGCGGVRLELGGTITPAVEEAFGEAAGMAAGEAERQYVRGLTDRVRRGELGLFVLSGGWDVAGAACYRSVDGEAELVFGFLRLPYAGTERAFLEQIVAALARSGAGVVRSGFAWPSSARFIAAAKGMGFLSVRRISMALDVDERYRPSYVPVPGLSVHPWSPLHFEEAARIMYEESVPADRRLYPMFGSPAGARRLLLSIVQGRHGAFAPETSAVCEAGGAGREDPDRIAGFVLTSTVADGSLLVLDIAVRQAYRRRGAGTKLLEYLIARAAALGKRQIVLAVTADNEPAIRLYRKVGFRQASMFDQYVLNIPQ